MADISVFTERFASSISQQGQPVAEMVNARLQRIQELERVRQEHASEHITNTGDSTTRHSRRDRVIRQASQRSAERRGLTSSIQRTPVRSQSFESASSVANVDEDTLNFRDMFESTRQNLFGPRVGGSNESLNGRRPSDSPLTVTRPTFQTGSDSGSGSSTPRGSVGLRQTQDFTTGLADAFSNIRSSLIRSDSTGALRETRRSSSITRETSSSSNVQRTAVSNTTGNSLTRSSSLRESRFRRRTIQGIDSNVSRALEQERIQTASTSVSRSISPLVMEAASTTSSSALSGSTSATQSRETTRTSSSFTSYSSAYSGRHPRKIDLYPDDGIPVLGFEDEKEIFVDSQGKCLWLNKTHALIRELKSTKKLPEIVMKPKLAITNGENSDGFIAAMEGDEEARYGKLRELVVLARKRDKNFENGDLTDSATSLSLLELYQRGDFIEDVDIDEKYKSFSLYTEPRPRQNIENLISLKEVPPIYDGIPRSELPQEIKDRDTDGSEPNQGIRTFENMLSASHSTSRTESVGATTRTEQSRSEASHEEILNESVDSSSSARFARSAAFHEASETQSDGIGNETSRYGQLHTQTEQAEIRQSDSVSNIFQRRAEARRQEYLASRGSSENGSSIIHRRAEQRRQQHLAQQQTNENGSVISRTRAEDMQQRFSSETHTSQNGSAIQRRSEERHQQYFTSQTDRSENGNSSVRRVEQSSMTRQSSHSSIVRQSSLTPIDNSDIHSEVNLVMERLQMMQDNANMPLDTSHLDYEEMLMIQKALAENPSPPDSPLAFESENLNTEEIISVSDEENNRNQPEEDSTYSMTTENLPLDSTATVSSTKTTTESTMTVVRSSSDNVIDTYSGSTAHSSGSKFVSAKQSIITHTRLEDDLETERDNVIGTELSSVQPASSEETVIKNVESDTVPSVKASVIEARTPRYQRLPSEGPECRLPLPSMDWSPLERSNSPLSPGRFSFEDKKSENASSASSTTSEAAVSNKFTIPKTSPQTGARPSVESELTIEIPSDNVTTSQNFQSEASSVVTENSANQNDSYKYDAETVKSPASPWDKNRGASVSSDSEALSPADSETVTTVYEEFIQTIPLSLLQKIQAEEDN